MRKQRPRQVNKSTQKLRIKVWPIIFGIIIIGVICFIAGYSWRQLLALDYFKIKDVITRDADAANLSYLKGRNIFNIDLSREADYILRCYPNYSRVKLIRVLPNRIFVDFIKRKAVAWVKLYKDFTVDQEGVLFNPTGEPQEFELPLILGLETKIFGPKPGKKYNIKELWVALSIIRETKRNRILRNLKIKKIDVSQPANTSFFMNFMPGIPNYTNMQVIAGSEFFEVKIGQGEIREKINILAGLIIQGKKQLPNIKYIDLRFKEPVIKFK